MSCMLHCGISLVVQSASGHFFLLGLCFCSTHGERFYNGALGLDFLANVREILTLICFVWTYTLISHSLYLLNFRGGNANDIALCCSYF